MPHEKSHDKKDKSYYLRATYSRNSTAFKIIIPHGEHGNSITALNFDTPWGTKCSSSYQDRINKVWDLNHIGTQLQVGELPGHLATVNCMQIDKRKLQYVTVTGSKVTTLKLWDLNLSRELYLDLQSALKEKTRRNCYTIGSRDKKIFHWDLTTGKCIQQLDLIFTPAHSDILKCLHVQLNNGAHVAWHRSAQ
ncbi:AIF_collapsed_G0031970.mRNA.1.CDS.1 [Saccharomyces cerevisiae]|nr:AIF_collapsed_G0031970.mRNA.1.CDS.1 [Saccharomyces cerevisiae]